MPNNGMTRVRHDCSCVVVVSKPCPSIGASAEKVHDITEIEHFEVGTED